jgi:xylulokinase
VDGAGRLVRPMISWQDSRTGAEVAELLRHIEANQYYRRCGLPPGTTWILTKILWMRNHEPDLYEKTARFVQNQDLMLRAFGADAFYTDLCDMAFYGLWDVQGGGWHRDLLDTFGLDAGLFGQPMPPGTQVGRLGADMAERTGFAVGTPVCVGAGDQNCSVIGMGAVRPGMGTVTLGTAGLAILATDRPVPGFGGMMITNHAVAGMWEVEGLSNAAACSFRWYRDEIGAGIGGPDRAAPSYERLGEVAGGAAPGSKGLLFMPYLAAAATPRWNPDARAAFLGLSLAHGRAELARAVMEGVVLEIRDMMEQWFANRMAVNGIRIGGGATRSPLWNQIQADVYGCPVQTVREKESTVLGAAILAGVGVGLFSGIAEGIDSMVKTDREFVPDAARHHLYQDLYGAYRAAYQGLQDSGAFTRLAELQRM